MSLFSVHDDAMNTGIIANLIDRNLGEQVISVEQCPGGANSLVYVATTKGGGRYFVKKYRHYPADRRDRLTTEFEGLTFLWTSGIRQIPRPLCQDPINNLGVYEYVTGRKLLPGQVSARHLDKAAEFVGKLFSIRQVPGASGQPLASEACLSLQRYVDVVQNRLDRLLAISGEDELAVRLRSYLDEVFLPFFCRVKAFFFEWVGDMGLDPVALLPEGRMVLSPSDFGFHNSIVTDAGRLVFIDFEYYGWDDPAKLIADFYLQPAVPVPPELREFFLEKLNCLMLNDSELSKRLPFTYVLSAFKWSLLLLNCFLHNDLAKRLAGKELFNQQLVRSRDTLQHLEEEMARRQFPLDRL
jgi:thiamine kinase-like enzyme